VLIIGHSQMRLSAVASQDRRAADEHGRVPMRTPAHRALPRLA
jgi:hypothetical protein